MKASLAYAVIRDGLDFHRSIIIPYKLKEEFGEVFVEINLTYLEACKTADDLNIITHIMNQ